MSEQRLQERLKALNDAYFQQLPEKITAAEQLWREILAGGEWGTQARELHRLLHSLAGSGATFGAQELSALAREVEYYVQDRMQHTAPLDAETAARIEGYLQDLKSCVEREVRQYSARR